MLKKQFKKNTFNNWLKNKDVDKTKDLFGNSLSRLTESMLRVIEDGESKSIGVINPSVNDYLFHKISQCEMILDNIIDNAMYFEQLSKMEVLNREKISNFIKAIILNGKFLELEGLSRTIEYYYLEQINRFNILKPNINKNIHEIFLKNTTYITPNPKYKSMKEIEAKPSQHLFIRFLDSDELCKCYQIENLLFDVDSVKSLLNHLEFDDIGSLVLFYKQVIDLKILKEEFLDDLELVLSENSSYQVEEVIVSELEEEISEIVCELFDDIDYDIKSDYYNDHDDLLERMIREGIEAEVYDKINLKNEELGGGFFSIRANVDVDEVIEQLNFVDNIEALLSPEPEDYYDDERWSYSSSDSCVEKNEIDAIFEREYEH